MNTKYMKINHLKGGIVLSYLLIFINSIIIIFLTPFMLKTLGQSQYGLYQLMGAFVGYMTILDFGLGNAVVRYVAQYRQLQDKKSETNFLAMILLLYGAIFILVIIIGSILYLNLSNIFSKSFTADELSQAKVMFIVLVFNLGVSLFGSTFNAAINAYEKFIYTRSFSIIRIILRVIFIIVLLNAGYKAISIVILDTFINLITILVNIIICKTQIDIKIKLYKFDKKLLFEISSYSIFIFLNLIYDQLYWNAPQLIIGIKMSTTAVAIFAVGTQFSLLFMQFSTAISGVFLPKITKMVVAGVNNEGLTDFMIKVGRLQGIVILFIYFGFILFGRQFIYLWVGEGFREAYIVALMVMTGLLVPLMENAGLSILQAMKRHKIFVIVYLIIFTLSIIATIFIIDYTGIIGTAMMIMLGLIIGPGIFINWYYYHKIGLNIPRYFKELFARILPATIISSLITYLIISKMQIVSWTSLALNTFIFSIIYFASMWIFGTNQYEKNLVLQPFKKIFIRR